MNKNIKLILLVNMYVFLCKINKWYIYKMKIIICILDNNTLYFRTLTNDIGVLHDKLIQVNGCRYHWKIRFEYNSF